MEEESKILKKSLSLIYDERMKEEEKVGIFVFVFAKKSGRLWTLKTNSYPAGKKSENENEEGVFLCGEEQRIAYTINRKKPTHTHRYP